MYAPEVSVRVDGEDLKAGDIRAAITAKGRAGAVGPSARRMPAQRSGSPQYHAPKSPAALEARPHIAGGERKRRSALGKAVELRPLDTEGK